MALDLDKLDFKILKEDAVYDTEGNVVNLRDKKKEGFKIYVDVGCEEDFHLLQFSGEKVFIVFVETYSIMYGLKSSRRKALLNVGIREAEKDKELPFSNGLFERVEAHYLLTVRKPRLDYQINYMLLLKELLRILTDDGLLIISGEFRSKVPEDVKWFLLQEIRNKYKMRATLVPMSITGRNLNEWNITYFISKNLEKIEKEIERQIEIAKKRAALDGTTYKVIWNEKAKLSPAVKLAAIDLLFIKGVIIGQELRKHMVRPFNYEKTFPEYNLAIRIKEDAKGEGTVEIAAGSRKFDEKRIICTIT